MSKNRYIFALLALFLLAGAMTIAFADSNSVAPAQPLGTTDLTSSKVSATGTSWSDWAYIDGGWCPNNNMYIHINKVHSGKNYAGWYKIQPGTYAQGMYLNCMLGAQSKTWVYVYENKDGEIYSSQYSESKV
jgi:hypothetical protein